MKGRKRKNLFNQPKMLSSRVEQSDYNKFESLVKSEGKKIQDVINAFVVSYVSGTIKMSGSSFIGGSHE